MRDAWVDRLSEYMDGGLEPAERETLEAHLADCAECAAALNDLTRVRDRARSLVDAEPERDMWPEVEARIRRSGLAPLPADGPRRSGALLSRRLSFTIPELAAAALALALLSGGGVWLMRSGPGGRPARTTDVSGSKTFATGATVVADSGAGPSALEHESAVAELRRALAGGRGKLDPTTVRTLEANLAIIDLAIDQARRALATDPANSYVRGHLAETMRRKVDLLRRATTLASASD